MALRISNSGGSKSKGGLLSGLKKGQASQAKSSLTQGRIPAKPAPKPSDLHQGRIKNTPSRSSSSSSSRKSTYSSGPVSSFSMSAPVEPATPAVPTEEDYLKGDATYNATISALAKQLKSFQTDLDTQRSNRKLDYDKAIKDLGYIGPNQWNFDDTLTASGRSYQNLVNDAASRGTLQSSGYADSLNDLTRSLMDQYTGINDSNTQFNTDLDRQLTKAKDENTSASQAARAEAIMRRAAQYGFGV